MAGELQQAGGEPAIDFEAFGDVGGEGATEADALDMEAQGDEGADDLDGEDDPEAKAKGPKDEDAEDDDLIDDADEPDAGDDPEFEIDADTKLTRSEIKALVEQKAQYSRYSDELQIVGRERQALESQAKVIETFVPTLKAEYEAALELIRAQIPDPPDASLMRSDPSTYLMLKEFRDQAIARYGDVKAKGEAAVAKATKEQEAAFERIKSERQVAEMDKLLRAVPQLRNERKADVYLKSITDFASKYGYSAKEIQDTILMDHRAALMLRKAALYDQSRSQKQPTPASGKAATAPRPIPAPRRSTASPQNGVDRRTLAKTLSNPRASRSDLMDKAASYFSD